MGGATPTNLSLRRALRQGPDGAETKGKAEIKAKRDGMMDKMAKATFSDSCLWLDTVKSFFR